MGIRFRKSIKLAPGVKLNLGKKGASLTLGGKYGRVTTGTKGVTMSASVPGTGLGYSTRIGPGSVRTKRPASARSTSKVSAPHLEQPFVISIDPESGAVKLLTPQNQALSHEVEEGLLKAHKERVFAALEDEIAHRKAMQETIENFHLSIPEAFEVPSFTPRAAPQLELPERPSSPWYTRLMGKLWTPTRQKLDARQKLYEQECLDMEQDHQRACEMHRRDELHRQHVFERRGVDIEAMEEFLTSELEQLSWPYETLVSFELVNETRLVFDVDLPEIEDLPTEKTSLTKRPPGLSFKEMSQADQRRQYMRHIHAIGLILLAMGFTRLPGVEHITLSAYSQRPDPRTARIEDMYLYSVRASRALFEQIEVSNLEALDVVECFERFELRRSMTKAGTFKPITPFVSQSMSSPV